MKAKGYSYSVIGKREINQDTSLVFDEVGLYAVADGIGGGLSGEVAADIAVEGLKNEVRKPDDLKSTILGLQTQILKEAIQRFSEPIMGTTLTAVLVAEGKLHLCHVGDSRCYLLRDNRLQQLTEDQEYYEESLDSPVLASYLGIPEPSQLLKIQEDTFSLVAGDQLVLCSDGLYRQLSETRIVKLLQGGLPGGELTKGLCAEASLADYSDNVTVVYVEIS